MSNLYAYELCPESSEGLTKPRVGLTSSSLPVPYEMLTHADPLGGGSSQFQ